MNAYITYLYQTTLPLPQAVSPALAIVPKQVAQPVTAPILCAVRLPDKYVYKDGALVDIRMRWTHAIFEHIGMDDEWYLLRDMHGVIGRRRGDILFANEVAEYSFAVLAGNKVA